MSKDSSTSSILEYREKLYKKFERNNGIRNGYSMNFLFGTGKDLDKAREAVKAIISINDAQIHKSNYYAMYILGLIHGMRSRGKLDFEKEISDQIMDKSYSWFSQYNEMAVDFNQHGGANGVLQHYQEKCWKEDATDEDSQRFQQDFIQIAMAHSYITGKHQYLIETYLDIEEYADTIREDKFLQRVKTTLVDLVSCYPDFWDQVNEERKRRESGEALRLKDMYPKLTVRYDPNKEFEENHLGKMANIESNIDSIPDSTQSANPGARQAEQEAIAAGKQ